MTESLARACEDWLLAGEPVVLVSVAVAKGSTPRESGARMLVTAQASAETIGGGRLEYQAISRANELLATGEARAELVVPLGPETGQCCGGRVTLSFRRMDRETLAELAAAEAAEADCRPSVLLFGAGHVGRALASALAPLPLRLSWIDERADAFPDRTPDDVRAVVTNRFLDEVEGAPCGVAYLVLTHSHALDFMVCEAVLRRGDFAYLGLIGSKTKRRCFERGFRELGIPLDMIARLVCPIGGGQVRDKRPAVIAALTAAELLTVLLSTKPPQEIRVDAADTRRAQRAAALSEA